MVSPHIAYQNAFAAMCYALLYCRQEKDCVPMRWAKIKLDDEEKSYLKYLDTALSDDKTAGNAIEMIVSEMNQAEFKRYFGGNVVPLTGDYAGLGIQGFTHWSHMPYKCLGPYFPAWQKGAVSWHPSVAGHRLRAGVCVFVCMSGFYRLPLFPTLCLYCFQATTPSSGCLDSARL
jgi:hypothetical protein